MNAVEFHQRLLLGQIEAPMEIKCKKWVDIDAIREWEESGKKILFPELLQGQSYSYTHTPEEYEIWREMAHQYALKHNHNNVYTGKTMHTSKEPLIKITFDN